MRTVHNVVVLDDYQGLAGELADWSACGPDVAVTFVREHLDGAELARAAAGAEILVLTRERSALPRTVLERLPALRHVVFTGSQNASIDFAATSEAGILVTRAHVPGSSVVEFVWALIFAVTKQVAREDRALRQGRWQETMGVDLAGATLGLAGLGNLGQGMLPVAQAIGMHVIAWSEHLKPELARSLEVEPVSKEDLLGRSDVLSVHLRLSARTTGLIGSAELALMKPTAYLVNTSRGPIIDERALVDALRRGDIAGAALDVFDVEPLPAGHPLLDLPNVVLTPHLGYVTRNRLGAAYEQVVENIKSYVLGSPINVVREQARRAPYEPGGHPMSQPCTL
jgi:phosphoglycerate dehydrogenase-like enzyme